MNAIELKANFPMQFTEKGIPMAAYADTKLVAQPVYKTTNYSLFTPNRLNRPTDHARVLRIVAEIHQGNNLLPEFPIIVDGNFTIIDGHHRHAAAKIAGVELYYRISATMTMEKAAKAVKETKGWTIADRLYHFVQAEVPDYVRVNNLWSEFEWVPVTTLIRLASSNSYQTAIFADGKYKADRIDFARNVLRMAEDFEKHHFKAWKSNLFINSLAQLASTPGYSHRRMMEKMEYQADKLRQNSTAEHYLENLSEIYNYKSTQAHRMEFRISRKLK